MDGFSLFGSDKAATVAATFTVVIVFLQQSIEILTDRSAFRSSWQDICRVNRAQQGLAFTHWFVR